MLMRGLNTLVKFLSKYQLWLTLSGVVLLIFTYLKRGITSVPIITKEETPVTKIDYAATVYSLLKATGLNSKIAKYATAQAAFETGGYNSAVLRANNNLFGMKYAGQVNAIGQKGNYAEYADINHSVADWVAWYTRHRMNLLSLPLIINSLASFVRFLKNNNYFEATESAYLAGVQSWYRQIFDTEG